MQFIKAKTTKTHAAKENKTKEIQLNKNNI